jgi:hypothetical protein
MFKLLKGPKDGQPMLFSDPTSDRARREDGLPPWPGTVVGIDLTVREHAQFAELLKEIRRAYSLDVRDQKKARYRRPKFA